MRELRWLLGVAPPFAALVGVVVLGGASLQASAAASDCLAGKLAATAQVSPTGGFVITPLLDASGTLAGQRVELGSARRATSRLELPPESFAAGPFGRAILIGSDDGRRSVLRAFDTATGCAWSLATETDVIRRATIDPAAGNVYEFRVDRATRGELGVWRRPLGGAPAALALAPLPADDRYGPTFSTELSWSAEGDVLVVQSCGMSICRTRLLDVAAGTARLVETADQGEVIGVVAGRLITYGACRGLPCPIASIDATTGEATNLVPAAGAGRMVATVSGPRVLAETGTADERELVLVDPASAISTELTGDFHGWHLVPSVARADGAVALPPGWAVLTREGRAPRAGEPAELLRVDDAATFDFTEVTR
jgi:hypothetical protein